MRSEQEQERLRETYRLIEAAQQGDIEARERLVRDNTGLVSVSARKFSGGTCEFEDLMQIGYMGLLKAIDRFDPEFGVMFSTYAVPMIMGEIRRYLRDDGKIKMSRQLKQDVKLLKSAEEEFMHENGRSPRVGELAAILQKTPEETAEILEAKNTLCGIVSLDGELYSETIKPPPQFVSDKDEADLIDLKNVIGKLGERERKIIVMRYFEDMTQQQTGQRLGISQVQVSRIEKKVLEKMKHNLSLCDSTVE
mgnify:CR=1 FL=1